MPKDDVLYVIDGQSKTRSAVGAFVLSGGGSGGSGGGGGDLSAYLKRDGTTAMLGNLDLGGYNVVNVSLLDGIDLPAHVANPNAHHAKLHDYNSEYDHVGLLLWNKLDFGNSNITDIRDRQHNDLQAIGPDDHHARIHDVVGVTHTIVGSALDLVGATSANTLGLVVPSANPVATSKVLKTDATGLLQIKRFEGGDFVKSLAYMQAGTYVQAGTYMSAVTYVDSPLFKYAGNLSVQAGINIYLDPTGYVSMGVSTGKTIRTPSFVSGFLGDGWQIDQNISAPGTNAEFDNLTIRGRMRVYELLIQRIRATNGSIFVTSVGKAKTVTLVSGDTYTIECDEDHGFLENDLIRAQQFTGNVPNPLYRCDMRVTGVTTLKIFTAVRENSSDIPKNGMDFVRLGNTTDVTRRGGLYLSSDDSNAPFMDVFDGISSWASWTTTGKVKTRIGKITGVTSTANEYGIITGNAGFGPTNSWIKASNVGIVLNNVPLQFFNGVAQTGFWQADGKSFWIGQNTSNRYIDWNGTTNTLSVRGIITIEAGGNAATTTDVGTAQTNAINYTVANAPNKALSNTTVNWALGATLGGNAYDTARVNGVAAATVQGYANRAGLGLNTNGDLVQAVQGPLLVGSPVNGLNLTSTYFGYYSTTFNDWTMFMKNDGTFRFGRAAVNNRIEWNGTQLVGYNSSGLVGWYASSGTGKLAFGAGSSTNFVGPGGVIDNLGVALISVTGLTDVPGSTISWYNTPETRSGYDGSIKMGTTGLVGFPPNGLIIDIPSFNDASVNYGNGIWHKWNSAYYLLWSQANHGPGSGLNADLLDGLEGTAYAKLNSTVVFTGNVTAGGALIGKYTTSSPVSQFAGAIYSPNMPGADPYGYFEYHYAGVRAALLLWSTTELRVIAEGSRNLLLMGSKVGVNRIDPSFAFDVAGEGRITGTLRTDIAYSLKPQGSPPGVSASYGILYVNAGGQLYYIRPNGAAGGTYVAG